MSIHSLATFESWHLVSRKEQDMNCQQDRTGERSHKWRLKFNLRIFLPTDNKISIKNSNNVFIIKFKVINCLKSCAIINLHNNLIWLTGETYRPNDVRINKSSLWYVESLTKEGHTIRRKFLWLIRICEHLVQTK